MKSKFYALLIGIDYYLPNQLPSGQYYPSLAGCVWDITLVEEFLQTKLKTPPECIFKLKSSNGITGKPSEPLELWPTYENMVAAFQKLADVANKGDQVYIHYSGHGGRTPTKFPELKGVKGKDESLVPMNIGDPEARYLRDIELAHILKKMVDKGLIVTLVLDSCHSGGATRGTGDAVVRGIDTIDTTERPTHSLVASDEELIATWQNLTHETSRDLTLGSGWLPEPKGYVLLAACRPHEKAHEYRADGRQKNGALTYWLLDSLKKIGENATYQLIYDRLVPKLHSQLKYQTPMLQGEGDRVIFGSDRFRSTPAVNVMQVSSENGQVLLQLNAGQVQGVRKGVKVAKLSPGAI
ncbi:MAG: caspase family protein [Okeania sp. SIO1H6]|nr:caspase family protein [Okeania sp. SIO1H6]